MVNLAGRLRASAEQSTVGGGRTMLALVESDAYRLGALIGRLLGILIPVVLGVVLAVRWHRRGRRLGWLWGALIAVGGVLVLLVASYLPRGGRGPDELGPGQRPAGPPGVRFP